MSEVRDLPIIQQCISWSCHGDDRRPWSRTCSRSCPCRLSIVAPGVSVKRRISESGGRQKKGDHPVDQPQTAISASRTAAWRGWIDSPAVRTLAVFLPAAAGFAIVQVNKGGDASFTTSGEFIVWSALIAVAVAIWVAMSLGLLQTVRELRGLFRDRGPALPVPGLFGVYGLYAAVLFAILTLGGRGPTPPLDHAAFRTRTILAIGLATAAPTVVTLWLVAERLRRLQPLLTAEAPLPDAGDRIDELRTLGRCSVRSLAAASVSVSLAVVLAGALRNALLAYNPEYWSEAFPASVLLLYGAFFTAAFAAVYMPALLTWRSRARQLVDAIYRVPDNGKPDEAWTTGRAALEQLLGINISVMAQLSGMLAIFGPLATSFLAGFVPQLANGQ
jgi:hypothetical protein